MRRVSVIIPVYNGARYIERCIKSVLVQTYPDVETIVVDDGSKDDSGAICDRLAALDSRVKVIHQENGGVNSARRKGVENSSGEWLVFVDADDCLPPDAIEKYSACFANGSEILVQGCQEGRMLNEEYLQALLKGTVGPALWAKAFKSDFYQSHCPDLGREVVMGEDLLINLVVGLNASSVCWVKGNLYDVNTGNSKSVTKVFKRTWEYEKHYFSILEDLFLNKCQGLKCYNQLELLVRKSQLNGIKYVMLSGNRVDYHDIYFRRIEEYFEGKRNLLGLSERLIFVVRNSLVYRTIMNLVISFHNNK